METFNRYFSRGKPLEHYLHHFIFANIGLLIVYLFYGSITVWEIILFFFMTFIPLIDELAFVTLTYIKRKESRQIVNLLLVGEMIALLHNLHEKRMEFEELFLHNIPMYLSLCSMLYVFFAFDIPILFFGLAGLVVHLGLDIINDQYEFNSISPWLWPFSMFSSDK